MKIPRIMSLFLIICSCVCSCTRQSGNNVKMMPTTSRFRSGQVWTFRAAPDELPGASLTVIRVDFDPEEGPIIYVWVKGVRQKVNSSYNFMPISEDALNQSVVTLIGTNAPLAGEDLQAFQEIYSSMHEGVKSGELGKCFKTNIAEVLELTRKTE